MSNILYLKKLDLALGKVKNLMESGECVLDLKLIKEKIKECKQEQEQLQWRYNELKKRL